MSDVINSILTNRTVTLGNQTRELIQGRPQGGVTSPIIWNLGMLDLLERLNTVFGSDNTAYADDLGVLIYGKNENSCQIVAGQCTSVLSEWCNRAGLTIKPEKTICTICKSNNETVEHLLSNCIDIIIEKREIDTLDQLLEFSSKLDALMLKLRNNH